MARHIISTHASRKENSQPQPQKSSLQLLVLTIGSLKLALPIQAVYRVVNQSSVYGSGLHPVGVAVIDNLEITVIDLHRRLFKEKQDPKSVNTTCLVIVQNQAGELYGIPTVDTPELMDVPLSALRVLPDSYRRADTLDIASHVALIPQGGKPLTIFVVDINQLLPTSTPAT